MFGYSDDKRDISALVSVGGGKCRDLRIAKVLLLLKISGRESNENEEYNFLQYLEVTRTIDTVDETLLCVCVWCSTDEEVDDSLRRGTEISEKGGLYVVERFKVVYDKNVEDLQRCKKDRRANSATVRFPKNNSLAIWAFLSELFL